MTEQAQHQVKTASNSYLIYSIVCLVMSILLFRSMFFDSIIFLMLALYVRLMPSLLSAYVVLGVSALILIYNMLDGFSLFAGGLNLVFAGSLTWLGYKLTVAHISLARALKFENKRLKTG
jgi:hypothetical protein